MMDFPNISWVLVILHLVLLFASNSSAAKMYMYRDKDSKGQSLEISLSEECINLPNLFVSSFQSFQTDVCVMAYYSLNCEASESRKFVPRNSSLDSPYTIMSVQRCNEREGGSHLNIDITTHTVFYDPPIIQRIFETYSNVRNCINVPQYIQNMNKWSIDNHGNSLFGYFERDCKKEYSRPLYIRAGHSQISRDIYSSKQTNYNGTIMKIQSFGPDLNSTFYIPRFVEYLKDLIMKIEMFEAYNNSATRIYTADFIGIQSNSTTGANEDLMHFFAGTNYKGFRFGSSLTSNCNKFPKPVQRRLKSGVGSLKTKTCVVLYLEDDCTGRSIRIEDPGTTNLTKVWELTIKGEQTLTLLYTQFPHWKWETKSYEVCNDYMAGLTLNLEIISSDPNLDPKDNKPIILQSYKNLCECRNVPEYVQQLQSWSVNNNGNSMIAYYEPDCSSEKFSPLKIPAGQSSYSFGLGLFQKVDQETGIFHNIQSFGPDPNAEYFKSQCIKVCLGCDPIIPKNALSCPICDPCPNFQFACNHCPDCHVSCPPCPNPCPKPFLKHEVQSICDSNSRNESMQVSLLVGESLKSLIAEFQNISIKIDEIKGLHQQSLRNTDNLMNDLEDQLQKQKDEFQIILDKITRDLKTIFA